VKHYSKPIPVYCIIVFLTMGLALYTRGFKLPTGKYAYQERGIYSLRLFFMGKPPGYRLKEWWNTYNQ